MYKKVLAIFVFCFTLISSNVQAAPAYGTRMPEQFKVFMGYQNYNVRERKLEGLSGQVESLQHFYLISYGIFDWLSLDLKGGFGDIKQSPVSTEIVDYGSYLAGGYGFRIKLIDNDDKKVVFGFQHISVHPEAETINLKKHKAVLDDWQFSFLGSIDIKRWTPYAGIRWSRMDYIHWVDSIRKREKSEDSDLIGLIVGCDIPLSEKTWLNIEGNFIDATAIATSFNVQF